MTVRVTVESVRADPGTLSAIAVLADDLRRRMYEFIRRADGPVTRDEAAAAVGISRKLAAFHLDKRALTLACETLERYGFEPARAEPTRVFLRNCPFQPLAAQAPDLVCAVNQAFLAGFLRGLGASTATAALTRPPGACCVELLAAGNA